MEEDQQETTNGEINGWELMNSKVGVDDMINLEEMNSETLLKNIEDRYSKNLIYVKNDSKI